MTPREIIERRIFLKQQHIELIKREIDHLEDHLLDEKKIEFENEK
jgi:hypothetical protein